MPISKFGTGCDCDCCVVFDSRFCEWINKNFIDDYTGGATFYPVSTNDFIEARRYYLNRTFCSGDANCAQQSGGYFDYETFAFAWPNYGPDPDDRDFFDDYEKLVFENKMSEYSWFTWMQFDHVQNPVATPYRNKLYFMFDYQDKDNWIGIGVEYDPDYNANPANRIFKINAWQMNDGTFGLLHGIEAEREVNLGSGDVRINVLVQVNIEPCSEDKNVVSLQIGDFGFQGYVISYEYTPINGEKSGICPEYSAQAAVQEIVCEGSDNPNQQYQTQQQIYKIQLQRTANDLAGCQTWGNECGCECAPSIEYDVTFSGLADPSPTCNDITCTALNTTFTLTRGSETVSVCGVGDSPCVWVYEESDYSAVACNVSRIELIKCNGQAGWILLVLLDLGTGYEVMAKFESTETDCTISDLDMGSIVSGCWNDSSAGFCPDTLCNASNLSATVSSS